ncbi:MAG: hypothetical protein PHF58_10560 [Methylotenera sp.]|nr:hypothetical protein [Methylotenera sp.]
MSIVIDELSDEVMNDKEISDRVAAMIQSKYPHPSEIKILRMCFANPNDAISKAAFDAYHLDVEAIRAEGASARAKAAIVREAIAYERAGDMLATTTPEVQAVLNARISARPIDLVM